MRVSALKCLLIAGPLALEACDGCNDQALKAVDKGPNEDVFADDFGSWLSMRALSDGSPVIAYYDRTYDALGLATGKLANDGTVTWTHERVDSFPDENGLNPGDAGKYASMQIASGDQIWIAYQDTSNGSLKYAHRGDGTWEIGIADTGSGAHPNAGYWASLALDPSGNPVVAHHDEEKGNLRVARWDGSKFAGEVVAEGEDFVPADGTETKPADVGEYAKLLIGADGTEYIAYYDRAFGALRLATGGASGFTSELVAGADGGADVGQWPDLYLDGSTLSIAYQDVTNQDLKLATGTPGSFSIETVDSADFVGADSSLFKDTDIGVAYFDGVNNDMKVAHKKGDAWESNAVASDGALGYHNESVKIGEKRYAACYDYTKRTVWFSALK